MSKGPTIGYLNEKLQDHADAQDMTVYCLLCPEWKATGTAEVTRAASAAHRDKRHPELAGKKMVVRKRRAFSSSMTQEREAEIEEERRQRMRALGIQ